MSSIKFNFIILYKGFKNLFWIKADQLVNLTCCGRIKYFYSHRIILGQIKVWNLFNKPKTIEANVIQVLHK